MVVWMVPRFSSMDHGSILWDFVGTWRVRVPIQLDFCGISTLQKMNQMYSQYVNNCTHPKVKWTVCISNRKVTWGLKNSGSGSRSVKSSKALLSLENVGFDERKTVNDQKMVRWKMIILGYSSFFFNKPSQSWICCSSLERDPTKDYYPKP